MAEQAAQVKALIPDYTGLGFKVADMALMDFGRKEIEIAEHEMHGLMAVRE